MAIVRLKKVTITGLRKEKQAALEKLQQLGQAHLIALNPQATKSQGELRQQNRDVLTALKYLNQCPRKRPQIDDMDDFDLDKTIAQILDIKEKSRQLSEQLEKVQLKIKHLEPWGDFKLPPLSALKGIRLWFYRVPRHLLKKIAKDLVWQVVHEDNIHCYVVVLSTKEPAHNAMPVARSHTGSVPLSTLRKQALQITLELEDLQAQRESLTRWITLISFSLLKYQDQLDLKQAILMALDTEDLFIIQAWLPIDAEAEMIRFAHRQQLALLFEVPVPKDTPPTLLKNPEWIAAGEDLIRFYQMPGYREWDPSGIVFFSFAAFFAMIMSDAGYASVLGLILLLKWKRAGQTEKGRRMRILALVIVLFSLLWGVITGSYFAIPLPPESILAKAAILDLSDFDQMMRLSIAVGVAHLILANLIKAWQSRKTTRALASIGWAVLAAAGFMEWLEFGQADTTMTASRAGIVTGLTLVLFFSSARPLSRPQDLFWRLLEGVKKMAQVSQIFGDALSYLRLFALGLASASLALTFNHLAGNVYHAIPGIGLFLSLLILLAGHLLNLMLCLMSGVVHGLRLNFIEFFHWSLSDEGYPFKVFACREEIGHG